MDKFCYYIFRGHAFCAKAAQSKYALINGFSALGMQLLMGVSYAVILKKGEEYAKQKMSGV